MTGDGTAALVSGSCGLMESSGGQAELHGTVVKQLGMSEGSS